MSRTQSASATVGQFPNTELYGQLDLPVSLGAGISPAEARAIGRFLICGRQGTSTKQEGNAAGFGNLLGRLAAIADSLVILTSSGTEPWIVPRALCRGHGGLEAPSPMLSIVVGSASGQPQLREPATAALDQ